MKGPPLIGVIDVGKSHTRLHLVDAATSRTVWSAQCASTTVAGPQLNELGLAQAEAWLLDALAHAPGRERISTLVPVAHGAAAVLLDGEGRRLQAPDYEDPRYARTRVAYELERDPFEQTFSPPLPDGQNLGAQLYFVQSELPLLWQQVARILPLPQYIAWRLSGVMSSEVTSLGTHTDLWLPLQRDYSPLAQRRGWVSRFAPLRRADEALGCVRPELARHIGLDPACHVLCGIHDSNAAYLAQRLRWPAERPFAVVSSGTWTVVMASGTSLAQLDPARDMLANVDVWGQAVATARFMGGREFAAVAGEAGLRCQPDAATARQLIARGSMALPAFSPAGGPFPGHQGQIAGPPPQDGVERVTLASIYLALVVDLMLDLLDFKGGTVLAGPLASNPLFPVLLAALRPDQAIMQSELADGSVAGALALAQSMRRSVVATSTAAAQSPRLSGLAAYKEAWRERGWRP